MKKETIGEKFSQLKKKLSINVKRVLQMPSKINNKNKIHT